MIYLEYTLACALTAALALAPAAWPVYCGTLFQVIRAFPEFKRHHVSHVVRGDKLVRL